MGEADLQLLVHQPNFLLGFGFPLPDLLELSVFFEVFLLQKRDKVCLLFSLPLIFPFQLPVKLLYYSLHFALAAIDLFLCLLPL